MVKVVDAPLVVGIVGFVWVSNVFHVVAVLFNGLCAGNEYRNEHNRAKQ